MTSAIKELSKPLQLYEEYINTRKQTELLCNPLAIEDYCLQAITETSPVKWHLAHTTWFFETFLLKRELKNYEPYHWSFEQLFNSYYQGVGTPFPREKRHLLSRPTVRDIYNYRRYVDNEMKQLLHRCNPSSAGYNDILFRTELGLNHEQQHQELLLTDLKYNLFQNPLYPAYEEISDPTHNETPMLEFIELSGGEHTIGYQGHAFAFDNEIPAHKVFLPPYRLASRLVTNGDYLEFIEDGGYQTPALWLADGWDCIQRHQWQAPLYWKKMEGDFFEYTLAGLRPLDLNLPVTHISFYEADAYARWTNCRLPSEFEWEAAASTTQKNGNFLESGHYHPQAARLSNGIQQLFGDTWEWTSSSYQAYPGFQTFSGEVGEYNGKFMCNQIVLRGGSCVSPRSHIRASYRNFFYPHHRWQFSGIRLVMN
ncbi:ergothioneine biosynthesis protein EgtB [Zooshikella sp. RANM57]|uniref:ergothioneine biosynthesis protein EgtB n=1 Tax=Zooshikella sp. RANM57 TaxID=3425863 RepID=UPI003D6FDDCC